MIIVEETDHRFYAGPSTIKGAGTGAFAKQDLTKGDWLEVVGVMVRGQGDELFTRFAERYKFGAQDGKTKVIPLGWAALINHTDDREQQNVEIRHLSKGANKRNSNSSSLIYYFLRDIPRGEEVLGFYGEEYSKSLQAMMDDQKVVDQNDAEWQRFLSFDLYKLREVL